MPFRWTVPLHSPKALCARGCSRYCHAVVHWNLPSNPVDMEQREGRVHRYKGHAVRKNVAAAYADRAVGTNGDVWAQLFAAACDDRDPGENDLVPYWVFPR